MKKRADIKTRFKKGQSGNPRGRQELSEIERAVRESSRRTIAESIEKIQNLTKKELEVFIKDKKNKTFEIGVAMGFIHWYKTGDFTKVDKIYDRVLGKSVQRTENQNTDNVELKIETTYTKKSIADIEKIIMYEATKRNTKK